MKPTRILIALLLMTGFFSGFGQRFSSEPDKFYGEVLKYFESLNNMAAQKIAYDFRSAWDGQWTPDQKEKIIRISTRMDERGYLRNPHFFNYFAYLAFAEAQEDIASDQMTKVLDVNLKVLEGLRKSEYAEFLLGVNYFFARRYLSYSPGVKVQAQGGSYSFDIVDGSFAIPDYNLVDTVYNYNDDPWKDDPYKAASYSNQTDPWATDPYATDPYYNDPYNNDPWAKTPINTGSTAYNQFPPRPGHNPVYRDYLLEHQGKYIYPLVEGPVINLEGVSILMVTNYDSIRIKKTKGTFILKNRVFAGNGGEVEWPGEHDKMDGAKVTFAQYHLEPDRTRFWTTQAKLNFNKFSDRPIDGTFEYDSPPREKKKLSNYPVFKSNNADIRVELSDKARYAGGLEIRGSAFYGKALTREKGTLTLDGKNGSKVKIRAVEFILGDSSMRTSNGSFTLMHGMDSIYHPSVEMWYDAEKHEVVVVRTKQGSISPFKSTYYGMEIQADMIKWKLDSDSIDFDIMQGKTKIPALVESDKYYADNRYKTLAGLFKIHPLMLAVNFSRKYGITEFYVQEIVKDQKGVDEKTARASMKILADFGYATYDAESGLVRLNDRAFHLFDAAAKTVDFDHLYLKSFATKEPNATMSLDSGQFILRGVKSFAVTKDYKIEIEPHEGRVKLMRNRNFTVDGVVRAGDFIYGGRDFQFDYDAFLIVMSQIDSIQLNVPLIDSTDVNNIHKEKTTLSNTITGTSGTLYLDKAENKSGRVKELAYPYFNSESEAIVYFDKKDILNGAYDRSVKFIIPPTEVDSLERSSGMSFEFSGRFNSGGIFPEFEETLRIQNDQSLGFVHNIPSEGYNLYGTEARTFETIKLNKQGIRGKGQIDFLTSQVLSDDFIYYPDSVSAIGTGGKIGPGLYKGASYPDAILGPFKMLWLPKKDSMYLRNINEPFKFYHSSAELTGEATITTRGVYGSGTLKSRGSITRSKEFHFEESKYSARHARFLIESNDPKKPAMDGKDVALEFDLVNLSATIRPEQQGVAAISFPYAQMKTSITEAVWDLVNEKVVMTKPANVDIKNSYFYTTRKELDSLAFNGERATYDMNSYELTVEGIPYIKVADAKIIPENNRTTILANSVLQEFKNAEIIIDTLNGFHHLTRGRIRVISSKQFEGMAYYVVTVDSDTFEIRFDTFMLKDVPIGNKKFRKMTVSGGEVLENQNLKIAKGFFYKGSVEMFAHKQALELDGFVRMDVRNIANANMWIPFQRNDDRVDPFIPLKNAVLEDGRQAVAGIHYNLKGEIYSTFVEVYQEEGDKDFYKADGELSYDRSTSSFRIETPAKTKGSYQGYSMFYNDSTGNILFEGPAQFFNPYTTDIGVKAAVLGTGNKLRNEYNLDAFITLDFIQAGTAMDEMGREISSAVEMLGANPANNVTEEFLRKLANIVGNDPAVNYFNQSLKGYTPLVNAGRDVQKSLVISGVKMKWNPQYKAWHNTTKLGLSHCGRIDINAKLDGFLEFKKDEFGADEMNLFIQASPESWYFIGYKDKNLVMFSSNEAFNSQIKSKSNLGKEKPGQLLFVLGDVNETLGFVNAFRKNYFGVTEPYNLYMPSDKKMGDEDFKTIEKDDDGF
jgi:hypothetical protein